MPRPAEPSPRPSRRTFLSFSGRALGGGWLALNLPLLASLQGCARDAALRGEPFHVLTADEGATLRALAAAILPPDGDFPGAGEAGAAHFVDRVLEGPLADLVEPVREGVAELDRMAADSGPGAGGFAELSPEAAEGVLGRFSETEAFGLLHFLVVCSIFAEPRWGGNRDAGWALVGLEHAPVHQPPFGFYDAEVMAQGEDA
jgi:hypothetical protein